MTSTKPQVSAPETASGSGGEAAADQPSDLDGDGIVGINDYLIVMGTWGGPEGDTNGDGTTDIADFLAVIGNWGPC